MGRIGVLRGGYSQAGWCGPRAVGGGAAATISGAAQIRALVVANGRFWSSVAPIARAELARWRTHAGRIRDQGLRELALAQLADEAFNAEVAATLATLAPRARRDAVVKAIVAIEVLFDYLDGRTEALFSPPAGAGAEPANAGPAVRERKLLEDGRRLYGTLTAAIDGYTCGHRPGLAGADSDYLDRLWRHAHEHASTLPGLAAVRSSAIVAASRCGEAQLRLHAAVEFGDGQLRQWAEQACQGSGLGWREYVGGCASSVLAVHALIATAARADASEAEAHALDATYLAIGAIITTLDSLVNDTRDKGAGEAGYIRLYNGRGEIQERLTTLIAEALTRADCMPDAAHHAMTLAGVAAYYTTHPGAADPENRAIRTAVRRQLTPTIWPALAVLTSWRTAKTVRGTLATVAHREGGAPRAGGARRAGHGRGVR